MWDLHHTNLEYFKKVDFKHQFSGNALTKRLREREREIEADERDRKKEKEEIELLRKRLLEENHSDPASAIAEVCEKFNKNDNTDQWSSGQSVCYRNVRLWFDSRSGQTKD